MATDILQKALRELKSLGAASETLSGAVTSFETAKDDRTRRLAGEYLRGALDQCIEHANGRFRGEQLASVLSLYQGLSAHVPVDPELSA
jgi:hypothetical protein